MDHDPAGRDPSPKGQHELLPVPRGSPAGRTCPQLPAPFFHPKGAAVRVVGEKRSLESKTAKWEGLNDNHISAQYDAMAFYFSQTQYFQITFTLKRFCENS